MIFISTCSITAMIACIFEHSQWRSALNDFIAHGYQRLELLGALTLDLLNVPTPGNDSAINMDRNTGGSNMHGLVQRTIAAGGADDDHLTRRTLLSFQARSWANCPPPHPHPPSHTHTHVFSIEINRRRLTRLLRVGAASRDDGGLLAGEDLPDDVARLVGEVRRAGVPHGGLGNSQQRF
jgi:hypothetical protein